VKSDWAWGKIGYGLFCATRMKEAREWLGSWRNHPRAEPWMLSNLVAALHHLGEDDEANAVLEHVLNRPTLHNITARFLILGAIRAGLKQQTAQLQQLLSAIREDQLNDFDRVLIEIPRILAEFLEGRASQFTPSHKERLRRFFRAHQNNKSLLRVFYRTCALIGEKLGSRGPILWAYRLQYLPVAVGVLIGIGFIIAYLKKNWS
jgi:hypothetical protein